MRYRRYFEAGGTYFFTLVTYQRQRIFVDNHHVSIFLKGLQTIQKRQPFDLLVYCIMPDHIHMIWKLPEDDDDYPTRIRLVKSYFSRCYSGDEPKISASRADKKERGIWQRRYWEHYIRNEKDLVKHTEYIFYNPVKHGLVKSPREWNYGNFQWYVESGLYERNWGSEIEPGYFKEIGFDD
jgi:putative transposase